MAKVITIKPDSVYKPHAAQLEFHRNPYRFRVLACGRRWGKSLCSIFEVYKVMKQCSSRSPRSWVLAPTFPMVDEDWKIAKDMFGRFRLIQDEQVAKMRLVLGMGDGRVGEMEFKSTDASDETLRGAGLDCALFDEAARTREDAWLKGVRPALADRRGKGIFISTPKGRNWFYRLWLQGQSRGGPGYGMGGQNFWRSWKFPSNSNPYFPKEEWDQLEATTPKQTWDQEYLAEFTADSSSAFGGVDALPTCRLNQRSDDDLYSIGVDLARTVDFTVIIVMNQLGQVIDFHRSRNLDWPFQEKFIESYARKYHPCAVYTDASGVGDPVVQTLQSRGVNARPIKTGSTTQKDDLIENLKIVIEQKWISLPDERTNPTIKWLWEELRSYSSERLEISGRMRYAAPQGQHDDGVIALALAAWGFKGRLGKKAAVQKPAEKYATYGDYLDIALNPKKSSRKGRIESFETLNIKRRVI